MRREEKPAMNSWLLTLLIIAGAGIGLWLASHLIEALRPSPAMPAALRWARDIPIRHVEVGGVRLRFITTGEGPTLVLLHTLRTQLDLFERMIPELSRHFTVYAVDYPGHGWSDIPDARYDSSLFAGAVEDFLHKLDLRNVTLAGVSIGGVIPLMIAARRNPRIARVISINPYDYAGGLGLARSSLFGFVTTYAALIPVLGEIFMRLRSFPIMRPILQGGVADAASIPPALMTELYETGNRPGHYRAFISLLRNARSWELAREGYGRIDVPTLLIYGDRDWSRPPEREQTRALIPDVTLTTIAGGGHFLPLDRPDELSALIVGFAGA
jgi:pimeloyl-ACP methyl ester carboxylesterase